MSSISWRFLLLSLLLIGFIVIVPGASAQDASTAVLSAPDTTDFPHLTAHLDVHDPTGAFVHGLTLQDVDIQENDIQVPLVALEEQKPGVQFIIAVSPGESFAIRDGQGVSRYEYLLQGLLSSAWVNPSAAVDDFSLLISGGPQVMHTSSPALIAASLQSYQPENLAATASLEALSGALQIISAPTIRPGMERAILFITSPQASEASLGIQSIISSASQQNIRIYVWLVATPDVLTLPDADVLRNLAASTRASFFAFSGTEPLPDLEAILEPLRYVYRLSYDSQVSAAGPQVLTAQVMLNGAPITAAAQSFQVDLQAPVPSFISIPPEIARVYSSSTPPAQGSTQAELLPSEQPIRIQVAFPDGYGRSLVRTSLYVDGALSAENVIEPFDQFIWNLQPYTMSGAHTLRVEVVDDLGLVGDTGDVSILLTVPPASQSFMVAFSQKRLLLVGVVVAISASILVLVLILAGRIHPRPHPGQVPVRASLSAKTRPAGYRERLRQLRDPVTQPVKITGLTSVATRPRHISWFERFPWFRKKARPPEPVAFLLPMANADDPTLPAPVQITTDEVTIGRNPLQATLVIPDPSLEELHSRVHHENGQFRITDLGSVSGTWVNFERVPSEGTLLHHADIIHVGAVVFRFNMVHPGPAPAIVTTPLEPEK